MLRPSTYPSSSIPLLKASKTRALVVELADDKRPTRGIEARSARATNGQAAAPPRAAMKVRRLISHPSDKGRTLAHRQPRIVRRITWIGNDVRVGSFTTGSNRRKVWRRPLVLQKRK